MDVSSYGNETVSSGDVKIIKDLDTSVEGRNVLIIEDIIDTGRTLKCLVDLFEKRNAKSVKICTLLDKPDRRIEGIVPDYTGFKVSKTNLLSVLGLITWATTGICHSLGF